MRWVSVFNGGRVGVQLTLEARPRNFFSFLFPTSDVFFIHLFIYLFIYFSTKMLISASHLSFFSILMLQLSSKENPHFHTSCVHFITTTANALQAIFEKSKEKNACTPDALDIAEIYLIIVSLCFTFAEPFDDIFSLRQVKLC